MLTSTLLLLLVASAYAAPAVNNAPEIVNNNAAYANAVVIYTPTTPDNLKCLKSSGYQAVFIRAAVNGGFEPNSVVTVRNAYNSGLGVEIYMDPQPNSDLSGSQQLDIMMQGLNNNGIIVRTVWFTVTVQPTWPADQIKNTVFINSILTRARQLGLSVGIYTNSVDWTRITNNWTGAGSDVFLWYYNVSGHGVAGESAPNFDDYVAFGGFKHVLIKQYALTETVCKLQVNRDVYVVGISAAAKSVAKDGKIVVGRIGL